LTIIARDEASGAMAGALLNEDAASPAPEGVDRLSDKFVPIFDLLDQLEDQVPDDDPPLPGEALHLFMLGVDRAFARRGIGQQLVVASLAHGAELGYRVAVTEAMNRVSQHIFAKLGFLSRAEVSYADYRYDGIAVFASIAEHGGPMSMRRDLSALV
jgi:ribosomal protein S18 acetylase RimI-like enzyme